MVAAAAAVVVVVLGTAGEGAGIANIGVLAISRSGQS